MEQDKNVLVLSATRTAIGKYGGGLAAVPPCDLAATVVREAVRRAGLQPDDVGHAVFGHVIHTEPRDMYLSRVAAINGGLPVETPAFTVNRLCGSGLQAIVSAAQAIKLGDCDVAVAGGVESMSRAQYWLPGMRWGQRMGDGAVVDAMVGALTDPFDGCHMAMTAENVADKYGITRQRQDEWALRSHQLAAAARDAGRFDAETVPVTECPEFRSDESINARLTAEDLASKKPAFRKAGTVTGGNSSPLNDGAAALLLMSQDAVRRAGVTPLARYVGSAAAGVHPDYMGIGPVPAMHKALGRAGWQLDEVGLLEINEAFAAQSVAVVDELKADPGLVNVNGGAIAIGHPLGCSGARIVTTLLHEMRRRGTARGAATMCIGVGQGIASLWEAA